MKKYKIRKTLYSDEDRGSIWIYEKSKSESPKRPNVKVKNRSGKSILCERHAADESFRRRYDERMKKIKKPLVDEEEFENIIFMSKWYRNRLNIGSDSVVELDIAELGKWRLAGWRVSKDHPQAVVRCAAWLGFFSILLGFLGFALGIFGVCLGAC
jgi:hypothetical protein